MKEYASLGYLKRFQEAIIAQTLIVDESMTLFEPIIEEWADLIRRQSAIGLVPLFITGSGISFPDVPDIGELIRQLKDRFDQNSDGFLQELRENMERLFQTFGEHTKKDRSVVGRILNTFQQDKALHILWRDFNQWLLKEKVLAARPSESHYVLAKLYEEANAICLTLNFDGLLIRKLREDRKIAFSIPDERECEKFFLRTESHEEFIEIQARGDILYLKCQGSGNGRGYCPERDEPPRPLWLFLPPELPTDKLYDFISRCPSCGGPRVSYISFPGSYEKEKDLQKILTIVWRYLAFRVGCLTVIGLSGSWDPLIVAFVGDLLKERDIPLLVVDIDPERSYLVHELVFPIPSNSIALKCHHNTFTHHLYTYFQKTTNISQAESLTVSKPLEPLIIGTFPERYWENNLIIKDPTIRNQVNKPISRFEESLLIEMRDEYNLDKYAQLGLKSRWLGIRSSDQSRYHNRLYHSFGVMKIASYLYDKTIDNYGFKRESEQRFLRIAALLHDIGHLPFSHLIEEIFQGLNWKPAKYEEFFTHSLNTAANIKEMFQRDPSFEKYLFSLGYTKDDLIRLINGEFGVAYLDAIINSPIDADKIDYIFRDTSSTDKRIILSPEQFLRDIVLEISLTPERFLAFSGGSAKTAVELLETRSFLYKNLYYRPGIRFLERALKFIIVTYFVHWVKLNPDKIKEIEVLFSDLGHYKILSCVEQLKCLVKEVVGRGGENEMELEIAREMKDFLLKTCPLGERVKKAVEFSFEKIEETTSEDKLKGLEARIIYYFPKGPREMTQIEKTRYIEAAKSCMLRLPGSVFIDVLESPRFLSVADARKEKERSDGTSTYAECIIVPSGEYRTWYPGQMANTSLFDCLARKEEKEVTVHLYPATKDETYVMHAKNLYTKLLEEKGAKEVE